MTWSEYVLLVSVLNFNATLKQSSMFSPRLLTHFDQVHQDIAGHLRPNGGNRDFAPYLDRSTRWPDAILFPDIAQHPGARTFMNDWTSRFGVPSRS